MASFRDENTLELLLLYLEKKSDYFDMCCVCIDFPVLYGVCTTCPGLTAHGYLARFCMRKLQDSVLSLHSLSGVE